MLTLWMVNLYILRGIFKSSGSLIFKKYEEPVVICEIVYTQVLAVFLSFNRVEGKRKESFGVL
jgi:hypothetical protein